MGNCRVGLIPPTTRLFKTYSSNHFRERLNSPLDEAANFPIIQKHEWADSSAG